MNDHTTAGATISSFEYALKVRWHTPCYEKLNALGWPAGFGVVAHGVRIGVRANDPDIIPSLISRLPAHARPIESEGRFDCVLSVINGGEPEGRVRKFNLLYQNHTQLTRSREFEPILDNFEMYFALTEAALAPRRVFVHAGVVGYRGQAILIPGKSFSGKSTLVSELVKLGATYYSDEFALLDKAGRVHPYARPIALRDGDRGKEILTAKDLGGKTGRRSLPVGMLLITEYKSDAKWRPKFLSSGQAFLELIANCTSAQTAPERSVAYLERAASCSLKMKTMRPEASLSAAKIVEIMDIHIDSKEPASECGKLAA